MDSVRLVASWPVDHVAVVAVAPTTAAVHEMPGPARRFALASISKTMTAWAVLVAVEEAIVDLNVALDPGRDRVPDGVTLRHLLAHAAGFAFDGDDPIAPPERTRIYSNTGIERAADVIARAADMSFADYLADAVFQPLGMRGAELVGSPAHGVQAGIDDLHRFLLELLRPRLIDAATRDEAIRPQYPGLAGIVPGVGRFTPCPWGLGFELHGSKSPHWMGTTNSSQTFGHFGGAGTMMWVDPVAGVGLAALTDRPFNTWAGEALRVWPQLSDAVLAEAATPNGVG